MVMSARSENHENDDFAYVWKVEAKSYQSQMKQNSYTELSGHSSAKTYNKNGPHKPPIPQIGIFPIRVSPIDPLQSQVQPSQGRPSNPNKPSKLTNSIAWRFALSVTFGLVFLIGLYRGSTGAR